jgi:AcrR family transcriptional regulator
VLAAARELFAERGYQATTVRAIAAAAGVTPAMIHHFFGSKEKVFLAAARIPVDPDTVLSALLAGPREQFPERLVAAFSAAWRSEQTGPALQSLVRAAVARPQEAASIRVFAEQLMLPRVAAYLDRPPAQVATAVSTLLGRAIAAVLLGIEPLASASDEELARYSVPAIRAALDL